MAICIVAVSSRNTWPFPLSVGFPAGVNPLGLFCSGAAAAFARCTAYFAQNGSRQGRCSVCRSGQERLRPALRAVAGGGRGFGDIGHVAKILQCADAAFDHRGGGAADRTI